MSSVAFVKPSLETDATWEMVRTSCYLGNWYMASLLRNRGHDVLYLDEVVRNNGLHRSELFHTELDLATNDLSIRPLDLSLEDYRRQKNRTFENTTPAEFVAQYSAFQDNKIVRTLARTGNSVEDTIARLERFNPDMICISLIATANLRAALRLGRALDAAFPGAKIVYGGQHVSALAESFVAEHPWVDHVVVGDGISVIEALVTGQETRRVVPSGFVPVKHFPVLDFDLLEETCYPRDQAYSYPSFGRKSIDFMFSKGCFRRCDFCVAGGQDGNFVSMWDWERVDEQLRLLEACGIEELIVQDDAFIYKPGETLAKRLALMKKYGFYWQNSGGIDFELLDDAVTEELIAYNRSGAGRLTGLYVPFNPRAWNRGMSATGSMVDKHQDNFNNLKRLREEGGVYVFTSEIVGNPEHSQEIIREDVEAHKEMISSGYLDAALTLSATMLPGTAWYEQNGPNIISKYDIPGFSLFTTHHRTDRLTPRAIEELIIYRTKELNSMQHTYNWQTAFPNSVWHYAD